MTKRSALLRSLTLIAVAAVVPLSACGSDDKEASKNPAKLNFTATQSGKAVTLAASGDKTPGTTNVTFKNGGKAPASVQLIAVTGEHSEAEFEKAYTGVTDGKPAPPWLFAAGGTGTTLPGKSGDVGLVLNEGTYWAAVEGEDDDSKPVFTKLVIKGDKNEAKLPTTGSTIAAKDYSFTPTGLKAGTNKVTFTNAGRQWHHLQAFPLAKGATVADAKKFLDSDGKAGGPPPIDFAAGNGTAVIEGGGTITSDLTLKKGKYVLICFISDRQGGKSHYDKGMITEAEVQ